MKYFLILFIIAGLTAAGSGQTQTKTSPQFKVPAGSTSGEGGSNGSYIIAPDEDYLIGPSDVLEVRVEDAAEVSGVYRLDSKGAMRLPIVGLIEAQAKRSDEVAEIIAERLKTAGYLVSPIVVVNVRQSNSRAFFIQGAVRKPGIYQIEGRPSLLKLITIAGGLADNYGSTAYLMREKKVAAAEAQIAPVAPAESGDEEIRPETANEEYSVTKVNINNLLRGNLDQNILISPGDIVHIPVADGFFVAGEVKTPGYFLLKEGTTLRQAVALAQGVSYQGDGEKGVIFREDESGKRTEMFVNIAAIMSGKAADIPILPNDIIMVPNSKKKELTKNLMKAFTSSVPGLIMRGLGIW